MQKGYDIESVDGSYELSKIASEYIGKEVIYCTFDNYTSEKSFDGIWACASLLHLKRKEV